VALPVKLVLTTTFRNDTTSNFQSLFVPQVLGIANRQSIESSAITHSVHLRLSESGSLWDGLLFRDLPRSPPCCPRHRPAPPSRCLDPLERITSFHSNPGTAESAAFLVMSLFLLNYQECCLAPSPRSGKIFRPRRRSWKWPLWAP